MAHCSRAGYVSFFELVSRKIMMQNSNINNNANNVLSDSQESALMDEETFNVIKNDIEEDLSLITEDNEWKLLEMTDSKRDLLTENNLAYGGKAMRIMVENQVEEKYFPLQDASLQLDDTFPGKLNFQFSFADGGSGQDWVYSSTLEKVYIKMEKTLPMRFTWDPPAEGLYVRTAMVFQLEQHRSDPVRRCHNHMASSINQNMDPPKIKHVVHCVNHSSSIYEERNEHLSILTPLCMSEPGSPYVPMCYKFLCKNSCPSGMNRRPTELIFTLEDHRKVVLGRRKLLVRICSCPKRDKDKEESEVMPKRKIPANKKLSIPTGKKLASSDNHVFKLEANIVGKENYLAVLKYAHDVMAGQAIRTGNYDIFKPYMDEILHKTP